MADLKDDPDYVSVQPETEPGVLRGIPQNLRTFIREENNKLMVEMRSSEKRLEQRIANLEKMIG
jgi:hypothetical protein